MKSSEEGDPQSLNGTSDLVLGSFTFAGARWLGTFPLRSKLLSVRRVNED